MRRDVTNFESVRIAWAEWRPLASNGCNQRNLRDIKPQAFIPLDFAFLPLQDSIFIFYLHNLKPRPWPLGHTGNKARKTFFSVLNPKMDPFTDSPRVRSDSMSSSASQSSKSKMLLRQRLSQLMTCIEDMSSDDEASEEVSRTLDDAFHLCGRFVPSDAFRLTRACAHSHRPSGKGTHVVKAKMFRSKSVKIWPELQLKLIWIMSGFLYSLTHFSGFQLYIKYSYMLKN